MRGDHPDVESDGTAGRRDFSIVGAAASAGGLQALTGVLGGMPASFGAPILVVQHLDPRHRSLMASILARRTALEVVEAAPGQRPEPGVVYVAPPDRHLLMGGGGRLQLSDSELVHFVRPSADLMFESLAGTHRDRTIAVVLSGTGQDGATGAQAVKEVGGTVVVQDPATAEFDGMPRAAISACDVDFVLPLPEIGPALVTLVDERSDV